MNVHTIAYITSSYLHNNLKQNTCGKVGEYFMINDDMCICLHQHTCILVCPGFVTLTINFYACAVIITCY